MTATDKGRLSHPRNAPRAISESESMNTAPPMPVKVLTPVASTAMTVSVAP